MKITHNNSLTHYEKWPILRCVYGESDLVNIAPQDYIQSQCTDVIGRNVTPGDTNVAIHAMQIRRCDVHRIHLIAPVENIKLFEVNLHNAVSQQPISIEILPTSLTSRHPDDESDTAVKITIAVCGYMELCNTTSYTTGLSCEHRPNIVQFSNISGTSTTKTVQQ